MTELQTDSLVVWHRDKDRTGAGLTSVLCSRLQRQTFFVETCMREFAVSNRAVDSVAIDNDPALQRLDGGTAYAFLLRTVTGLNSSIPGETNVQGQVRNAWNHWRQHADQSRVVALNTLMHRLFTDSRAVRRQYLQGIGGHSYGSLVRKLLAPDADARILFVGAGELARSITPFFRSQNTAVWNRHATDSVSVGTNFAFAPDDTTAAADWATHVILTTPPDSGNDAKWAKLLDSQPVRRQIVHLGIRRARHGSWLNHDHFSDLDDVLELRQTQSSLRQRRLELARRACDRLAFAGIDAKAA